MMSEFRFGSSKRTKLDFFDVNYCIFCKSSFSKKTPAVIPQLDKLPSLFTACRQRQDETSIYLLDNESDILNGKLTFKYHRHCRSTHCSKDHIKRKCNDTDVGGGACSGVGTDSIGGGDDLSKSVFTRSQLAESEFNWKKLCFICGKPCHPSHRFANTKANWSMVETAIDDTTPNLYYMVLHVAEDCDDDVMIQRLRGIGPDLVAAEARYHQKKNCLPAYLNQEKVPGSADSECNMRTYGKIIQQLKDEFYSSIMADNHVYLLTTLRTRFKEIAHENEVDNPDSYTSQNLKKQLQKEWPGLSFIPQRGMSDFVCSSELSVRDALCKINEQCKYLNLIADEAEILPSKADAASEESIVHMAVGILRRRMSQLSAPENEYYSSQEMAMKASQKFVDPLLYKALGWLTNKELYDNADNIHGNEKNSKCLNIACDIITLATGLLSPKHLGLSVSLHHDFGSRKLVEHMYQLGYGISYTELRHFLTSAAVHITSTQHAGPMGSLIPPELVPKEEGGKQVIAVGDNWDHNERTTDGKRTTHAMTSIIVTPQLEQGIHFPRIPRLPSRSYNLSSLPGGNLSSVIPYVKPVQRVQPVLIPSPTLDEIKPDRGSDVMSKAVATELIYNLSRSFEALSGDAPEQYCPPWGPFHVSISSNVPSPLSVVAYNPILMAPPTDYATVFTTLVRNKEITNALGHSHTPIFFDMGLLTKALEVTWSRPRELTGVIPCEGGMHLAMAIMAGIGHLYGDAGLRNLLQDSGVFAGGTVQQILAGKDFDRSIRAIKMLDEVLHFQFFKNFRMWCVQKEIPVPQKVLGLLDDLQRAYSDPHSRPLEVMDELIDTVDKTLSPLIAQFRDDGRRISPTFKLWNDYLQRVSLPFKVFLAASREGNWEAYQASKAELLPLLFASNRSVYAKYMSVMILLMKRLPQTIQNHFKEDRQFVSKLTNGSFNMTWPDYVLESTENKSLKGIGGIIGLTLRASALARWFLTRPVTAQYSTNFHVNMCQPQKQDSANLQHHSCRKSAVKQWNNDIEKMKTMFDETYMDPFSLDDPPPQLVNFASGVIATTAVQESLTEALEKGNAMAEKFVSERLVPAAENGSPAKSFYEPLPRSGVRTMTELTKSIKIGKKEVHMNAEIMYLRLLAINAKKQVPLERVFSFENSPVPLSMFAEDGTMLAGTKSQFMHKLEDVVPGDKITSMHDVDATIIDGHAVIQMLIPANNSGKICFKDIAHRFMQYILNLHKSPGTHPAQIHVIFDRYLSESIKAHTREKRSGGMRANAIHVGGDVPIPRNWPLFLTSPCNKAALAKYYTTFMETEAGVFLSLGQTLFISGGLEETVVAITRYSSVRGVQLLDSNQEEADTKLVLHAVYAANQHADKIIIFSPDTDVLVLLLHHRAAIPASEIFLMTGHDGKHASLKRYIPVHDMYQQFSTEQHRIMLSIYCITGCDTTSAFYGHGKRTAFKLMMQQTAKFQALATLGTALVISQHEKVASIRFVSCMYGKDSECINTLRCERAGKNVLGKKLPPTDDSLQLHIKRCAYQLQVWRQATTAMQTLPVPTEYGYTKDAMNALQPTLMSQNVSAPELLNGLICKCDDYCSNVCSCMLHNQPCTAACICEAEPPIGLLNDDTAVWCANPLTIEVVAYESDSDSDKNDS